MKTLRQRADLTFKHNVSRGRHGWLRLTPAYSVKLVEQILRDIPRGASVLDPFSGTATTPLCAAQHGSVGTAVDINPFLVWLGQVKCRRYQPSVVTSYQEAVDRVVLAVRDGCEQVPVPPIHDPQRWWDLDALAFLCKLRGAIRAAETSFGTSVNDLLRVAFLRTMIAVSNAAFNHQSMSFKNGNGRPRQAEFAATCGTLLDQFIGDAGTIGASIAPNPAASAHVVLGDSRKLDDDAIAKRAPFDCLITSPPYPNRMSYIRELRPYMYWLGFLTAAREAGDLDWAAIGGTWGAATSRLLGWKKPTAELPRLLQPILERIRDSHPRNGILMATYVQKYFCDMDEHFAAAARLLKKGGSAHYIIGNAIFYGHAVPAERMYVEMLQRAGFRDPRASVVRKRNSKKDLYEFHVHARR